MALYRPDNKLIKAIDLFKYMTGELENLPKRLKDITQEEKDDLLVYLLKNKNEHIDSLYKRNKEYQEVFNAIGKFIPHKGPTVYG